MLNALQLRAHLIKQNPTDKFMEKRAYRNTSKDFFEGLIAPLAACMHSSTASKQIICS